MSQFVRRQRVLGAVASVVLLLAGTLAVGVAPASATPPAGLVVTYFYDGADTSTYPTAIAFDSSGNLYVADKSSDLVTKIATNGVETVIAGTVNGGGLTVGPATQVSLDNPHGVAVDSSGNVFIADTGNNRIVKVTPGGTLSVFAGNGGFGLPTAGPATSSTLGYPQGVAVDSSGNVFIADTYNSMILKVTSGGTLSVVAGTNSYGAPTAGPATNSMLYFPAGVAVDSSGNVFIADTYNSMIEKVTPGGTLSILAGTGTRSAPTAGPATSSALSRPAGVAVDSSGNVYIADTYNSMIEKVTPGGTLSIIAGDGSSGNATEGAAVDSAIENPDAVAVDSAGDIYAVESTQYLVLKLSAAAVAPKALKALKATPLDRAASIEFSIVSNGGAPISKYQYSIDGGTNWSDTEAGTTSPVTVSGLTNGTNYSIKLRAVNSAGDGAASAAVVVTPRIGYTMSFVAGVAGWSGAPTPGPALSSYLSSPLDVAVDSSGNLYIADSGNQMVLKVTSGGTLSVVAGTGTYGAPTTGPATSSKLESPQGVAVDSAGNLYVSSTDSHRVVKIDTGGNLSFFAGTGLPGSPTPGTATSSKLNSPRDLAVDSVGNVYISDSDNNRIVKVTPGGTLSIFAGTGSFGAPTAGPATSSALGYPSGIAVDSADNVYLADAYNSMIEKVTPGGTLSIFAGTGTFGAPTEGPARDSDLGSPSGVAVDSAGNVYISDSGNNLIEKIDTDGNLSIIAGTGSFGDPTAGPARLTNVSAGGIAVDSEGSLFNANFVASRIEKYTQPPTEPAAPTSLSATPGNGSASISFTTGANGGAAITKYQYTTDDGGSWSDTVVGTSSPVSITGLTNGTSYSIKLRAYNSVGGGAKSSAVSVTPRTTPSAPTGLVATSGTGSASIAFTAGSDGGASITKYQYKVGTGSWTDAVGTTSPITISGLTNFVSASIRLRAVNGAGIGPASIAVEVISRPSGPAVFAATASGRNGIVVTFNLNPLPGTTVAYQSVVAYARGTNTVRGTCRTYGKQTTCFIGGLTRATNYDLRVTAHLPVPGKSWHNTTAAGSILQVSTNR